MFQKVRVLAVWVIALGSYTLLRPAPLQAENEGSWDCTADGTGCCFCAFPVCTGGFTSGTMHCKVSYTCPAQGCKLA
jgi:hypothetical protein